MDRVLAPGPSATNAPDPYPDHPRIPNHYTPNLSELDLRMIRAVPPGGNWKSIPPDIPSARLAQIRATFASGNGSRSTYYGRLDPSMPAFTISTCINRPGNGCYIHYDSNENRLISQREAARLQSFPDWFEFHGSKVSVNKQIGNAVPPLLAYQVANALPFPGAYVDLFCGAGGLSLGFKTAGWRPVLGVDHDMSAIETYSANIDRNVIAGSLSDPEVFEKAVVTVRRIRPKRLPLYVIGGPPCQGLSTAGNRRSREDPRNNLFHQFSKFLERVSPDGFVFENVPGILSMDHGRFIEDVELELSRHAPKIDRWVLNAVEFGVPQRRRRVFLIGSRRGVEAPKHRTPFSLRAPGQAALDGSARATTVKEALDDLPPLTPGQDGSRLNYVHLPSGPYQRLMRGRMSSDDISGFEQARYASSPYI